MDRSIQAYARDRQNRLVPRTTFKLHTPAGIELGRVVDSDGRATFQLTGKRGPLKISAEYNEEIQETLLNKDIDAWTFRFNIDLEPSMTGGWSSNIPAILGLTLLALALTLAFCFPDATPLQAQLIRSTAALGAGGIASVLTGMITAKVTLGKQFAVSATGALAVYVISFFFVPAG